VTAGLKMTHACHKLPFAPTCIEHCVRANFISENQTNLIVARYTLLQIYEIRTNNVEEQGTQQGQASLDLVCEFNLFGNIEGLSVVRFPQKRRDYLLLSIADAKISIVEWDLASWDLKLVSLHFYENDEKFQECHSRIIRKPLMIVSPDNKCAVMLVYDKQIVVLPFQASFSQNANMMDSPVSYIVDLPSLNIWHIKDIQFVNGHNDPTICVLFEPKITAPNRYALGQNTCHIVTISLNLTTKTNPITWHKEKLPHDCYKVIPVPLPVGGVIILASNSVHYYCHTNYFGMSFNTFADELVMERKLEKSKFTTTLDSANGVWLNDTCLLLSSGITGELLLLSIVIANKAAVRFVLSRVGESCASSCMTLLSNEHLFLGSRLDDSVLLRFLRDENNVEEEILQLNDIKEEEVEESEKILSSLVSNPNLNHEEKQNAIVEYFTNQNIFPWIEPTDEKDQLFLELLRESELIRFFEMRPKKINFKFSVCDTLLNIGPIVDSTVAVSFDSATLSVIENQASTDRASNISELICCSGRHKGGALSILQEGIRPEVNRSVYLKGFDLTNLWAVTHAEEGTEEHDGSLLASKYLILSNESRSMVLEVDAENLSEISGRAGVELYTNGPTIGVANLFENKRIVQIHTRAVLLLNGTTLSQEWLPPPEVTIVSCRVLDPYIILEFSNQKLFILLAVVYQGEMKLVDVDNANFNDEQSAVSAYCLFQDYSRLPIFNSYSQGEEHYHEKNIDMKVNEKLQDPSISKKRERQVYENDFEYEEQPDDSNAMKMIPENMIYRPYYCAVTLVDGLLQIFKIKGTALTRVFSAPSFSNGANVIMDDASDYIGSSRPKKLSVKQTGDQLSVVELTIHSFGNAWTSPYLFALLSNGDLFVYQAFHFVSNVKFRDDSLSLRFKRVIHNVLFHNIKSKQETETAAEGDPFRAFNPNSTNTNKKIKYPRITTFNNISQKKGLFITGHRPYWIFEDRSFLRFHPMTIEGSVIGFTPFHNVSNAHSFIYYSSSQSKLTIGQLNDDFQMDMPMLLRKIRLGVTPNKVVYHSVSKLIVTVVSFPIQNDDVYHRCALQRNDEEEKPIERDEILIPIPARTPTLYDEGYEIRLVSPETWSTIHTYKMKEQEVVLCSVICNLRIKQDNGRKVLQPFLIVGTSILRGQDLPGKGRILIFDVLRPQDVSLSRFEIVYEKEQRGPVSSITQVDGNVAIAIGTKILVFHFEDRKELEGVAFFDCQMLTVCMASIKNYFVLGDIYKGAHFMRWKERIQQIELLSKDYDPCHSLAVEFLVDGPELTLLVCDTTCNLHVFSYNPDDPMSQFGKKLMCVGNFYLGSPVNKFTRLKLNTIKTAKKDDKLMQTRSCVNYVTLNGSVGFISPLSAADFQKLGRLEMRLVSALNHAAGLNPKAFRLTKPAYKMSHNHQRNMIDGDLLLKFASLERTKQDELAALVKLTTNDIIDHLLLLHLETSFF
jgi:cleavage and polyadenylation specificity factor subunit 1